ncbi:9528_t:CDS:1, partial [Racocetra persica]
KSTITEDLVNNFSTIPNFETKEKVEELLAPLKDNPEFLQQHPDLTTKSPKEIIIAAKRFTYDQEKQAKESEIRQYYNLAEDQMLTDYQINEYLYLEATNQLQQTQEGSITSSYNDNS